jgi:hypothetical protein
MTIQYYMRGYNTAAPGSTGYISWVSPNQPDPTGALIPAPYLPANVKNITINDVVTTDSEPAGPAGGDLSGSYPDPAVAQIQGFSVPAPTGSNTVLTYNGSSLVWLTPSSGGGFTAGGDLSGSSTSQQVIQISSATGSINWAQSASPSITQTTQTSDAAPNNLTIQAQSAYTLASHNTHGGSLILSGGNETTNTNSPASIVISGASEAFGLDRIEIVTSNIGFEQYAGIPITQWIPANGGTLLPQTNNTGSLGTTSNYWANVYINNIIISPLASNPSISQITQTSDAAPNNLTIQAQSAYTLASHNTHGGSLILSGGNETTDTNSPASIVISGASEAFGLDRIEIATSNIGFEQYAGTPITQWIPANGGTLLPQNNYTGSLGTTSNYWQNAYVVTINATQINAGSLSSSNIQSQSLSIGSLILQNDAAGGIESVNALGFEQTVAASGQGTPNTQSALDLKQEVFFSTNATSPRIYYTFIMPSGNHTIFGKARFLGKNTTTLSTYCCECNFAGRSNGATAVYDISPGSGIVSGSNLGMTASNIYSIPAGGNLSIGVAAPISNPIDWVMKIEWLIN